MLILSRGKILIYWLESFRYLAITRLCNESNSLRNRIPPLFAHNFALKTLEVGVWSFLQHLAVTIIAISRAWFVHAEIYRFSVSRKQNLHKHKKKTDLI